ncbi:MAG: pyruvate kinase alpha/beta domain-containing protein [Candidatus Aminicenantales bacterium]
MEEKSNLRLESYSAPCFYFARPGPQNTELLLKIAARRSQELGIKQAVVASTSGRTGLLATQYLKGLGLVVVSHSTGFLRPDYQEMNQKNRQKIEAAGGRILTCQHAFGGVGRAVRKKLGSYQVDEIMAYTLRVFGEGVKVAIEVALMAADAGYIQTSEPCLAIGGTGSGADTALILKPTNSQTFFDLRVMEILAKPRLG